MAKKKRSRGTGGIYIKDGIWWMKYYISGKPRYESSRSKVKSEAERQLKIKIGQIAGGDVRFAVTSKVTIGSLCDLVIRDYKIRQKKSLYDLELRIERRIRPKLGNKKASAFGTEQVNLFIEERRSEGASNATINRELAIIRRGFTLALEADPPQVYRAPKILKLNEDNVREGFVERDQYAAVLDALPFRLKALFVSGYHLGMRLGELRNMKWSQVDLDAGEIKLARRATKGNQARTAPIYGDLDEWLRLQRSEQGRTFPDVPWVFNYLNKQIGKHLKGWHTAVAAAGLPDLRFHDLRRSAVRNMERAGITRSLAMAISGHKTESVYRRYDIVSVRDMKNVKSRMDAYLNGANGDV